MTELSQVQKRIICAFVVNGAVLLLLASILVGIQGFGLGPEPRMRYVTRVITLPRGAILDRNGTVLATSPEEYWAILNPRHVINPNETAERLARHLSLPPAMVLARMEAGLPAAKRRGYVVLKRDVSSEEVELIRGYQQHAAKVGLKTNPWAGLMFESFSRRSRPHGSIGCQILGVVGFHNLQEVGDRFSLSDRLRRASNRLEIGQSGVEQGLDTYLSGSPGFIVAETDARGHQIPSGWEDRRDPVPGSDVVLTIDESIQRIVEAAVERCRAKFSARYVSAIVMAPRTGEILAMATSPGFDPDHFPVKHPDRAVNWAVSALYEPGSTFKVILAAAAIEALPGWQRIHAYCPGRKQYGNRSVRCWILNSRGHGHGTRDLATGIRDSCNLTMAEFGRRLGASRLRNYMQRFGLTESTGIQYLPGDRVGAVPKATSMPAVTLAGMSFGQHFSTTPLALLTAVNTIANDGTLVRPRIVSEIRSRSGETLEKTPTRIKTGVIRRDTAHLVRDMMIDVVEKGTGKQARIPGVLVAGKTGTAQKAVGHRGYVKGKYICSFVGFVPANDPQLSILVVANEPNAASGGVVAAPTFREIAEQALARLNAHPSMLAAR